MTDIYTTTLQSSLKLMSVPIQMDFGEIIIASLLLAVLAVMVIEIVYQAVYQK